MFSRLLLFTLLTSALHAAKPFVPNLGPDLPSITVTCGEVSLLLRQASQWTPGRIDFRGHAMTTERSAYGTVFSFPDCGFVGTAHLENEPEPLQSLTFILDGKTLEKPEAVLKGQTFRFERKSRIRDFDLTCIWELKDDRLYETTTVRTAQAVPLKLVYHFMHAWARACPPSALERMLSLTKSFPALSTMAMTQRGSFSSTNASTGWLSLSRKVASSASRVC